MKKLFPENKVSRKSLMEFLDKKGFFIVLIICIAIVGATAVFVTTISNSPSTSDYDPEKIIPEEVSADSSHENDNKSSAQSSITSSSPSESTKLAVNNQTDAVKAASQNSENKTTTQSSNQTSSAPAKTAGVKSATVVKTQELAVPVLGSVSFEYSQDKLVFSKTLDEWTTHSGVDIAAERGTAVKAAADGVVSEIKNDPRLGITIIIDHQNGIKTVYANLASDEMVTPNQKVKQGDVIGSVGNTSAFESAEQPHLHFEVLKNNIPVNPAEYLPKK